ncbi:MAG: hypothetical protein FJ042_03575 [Candidatus Cloacimonetes bacterium]|nr:hypothetical protein [Candidatus Cloacimonadota bacterium]
MKRYMIFILICLSGTMLSAQASPALEFPLPQYMNPFYDGYSRNRLDALSTGKGGTGIAQTGGVEHALINPAGFMPENSMIYLEMCIKPPISEIDRTQNQTYAVQVPFGLAAVGGKLLEDLYGGFSYSMPKSLIYYDFNIVMNQGAYLLQRNPTYMLHQLTGTLSYQTDRFGMGVNVHNRFHYLDDVTFRNTFDRLRETNYALSPELGIIYKGDQIGLGATFTPELKAEYDLRYRNYESVHPMKASGGISLSYGRRIFNAEAEWEQCSAMDDHYDDRLTLKGGYEIRIRKYTYRFGLLSTNSVFSGDYLLPVNTTANADTSIVWDQVPLGGTIKPNDQLFATFGFSFHHKDGIISAALMQEMLGKMPVTQINLSLGLNFSAFRKQGFLYFD